METAYDWITVLIFAVVVTRYLSQSVKPEGSDDRLWHYLLPAAGCAFGNWLGNEGWDLAAIAVIGATLVTVAWIFGLLPHPRSKH
jgi:hypothetical protein